MVWGGEGWCGACVVRWCGVVRGGVVWCGEVVRSGVGWCGVVW